jgi:hypothetical protein
MILGMLGVPSGLSVSDLEVPRVVLKVWDLCRVRGVTLHSSW